MFNSSNDSIYRICQFLEKTFCLGPEATEKIFRSQHNIYKGQFYTFFLPWLKTGLLTSTGAKWKDRRRLLTPAFHKHVLEDYLETMNEKADIMIKNLKAKMKTNKSIEIQKFITLCALDIIVETAMGATSDLQSQGDNDYVNAIYSGNLNSPGSIGAQGTFGC